MKFINKIYTLSLLAFLATAITSCQKGDLLNNPNAAGDGTLVPPSLLLNRITSNLIKAEEQPFAQAHRTNQYYVSNYSYYWGSNFYNWSNSDQQYETFRYAVKLEEQAAKLGNTTNAYFALSKFFKAYSAIWLSQRVGDIPMSEAVNTTILTPKFDSQKEVYRSSLALLEDANTVMANLLAITPANKNLVFDAQGDVFGLTYIQWQKVINTYKLRVLISLSKRADDNADLNVKAQFAAIIGNTAKYPVMEAINDNMLYKYNASFNPYPVFTSKSYSYGVNISKTLLDITTSSEDPRTFVFATPAPAQYKTAGKNAGDFSAYAGASTNTDQAVLFAGTDVLGSTSADKGAYSYINFKRYFSSQDGSTAEPYILLGYPEMCFNIAEAINRGWLGGDAKSWYDKGINASLGVYGLTNGQVFPVSDRLGATIATTVIDIPRFLANQNVAYKGNSADGLKQILTQKYVSMFCNSGYEPFYNWLRTGYPAFAEGGVGIGTPNNKLSRRWMYPQNEITYNSANYQASIQSQYGGNDDITKDTWLNK